MKYHNCRKHILMVSLICMTAVSVFLFSGCSRGETGRGPGEEAAAETVSVPAEFNAGAADEYDFLCRISSLYTYDEMTQDIRKLQERFGDQVRVEALTETLDGRKVYDIRVGSRSPRHQIMINGAIHGREYITAKLVMCQALDILENAAAGAAYGGVAVTDLLNDTEIHFIPMINPDGVTISQLGLEGINSPEVRDRIGAIAAMDMPEPGADYLVQWKSNANGVDLNRNFDAFWEAYDDGVHHPSSAKYKGPAAECEPESFAVASLVRDNCFSAILSYHTMGEVIYWYFRQHGDLMEASKYFADRLSALTGYLVDVNFQTQDPAGLKDWAIDKEGIPGYTIEVGTGGNPVDPAQFQRIWIQNQYIVPETLLAAAGEQLHPFIQAQLSSGDTMTVVNCNEFITLRSGPSTDAEALDRIPLGQTVTYIGADPPDSEFYQIMYNGRTGYALIGYLK